jgi:hypothetical protein
VDLVAGERSIALRTQWTFAKSCGLAIGMLAFVTGAHAQAPSWNWSGDARLRYDMKTKRHLSSEEGSRSSSYKYTDQLLKLRARIGASGVLPSGKVSWGVKLATSANDKVGRNALLGGGNLGGNANVGVDLAYIGLKPTKKIDVVLGKMANPFVACDGIFDPDLTPEGAAVVIDVAKGKKGAVIKNVVNTAAYLPLDAANPLKTMMLADQIKMGIGPVNTAFAIYHTLGIKGGVYPMDQVSVLHAKAAWDLPIAKKTFPMTLGGDFWINVANVTSGQNKDKVGGEVRLDMAKVWKGKAFVAWRNVGRYSTYASWTDSDFGEGPGYSGLRAEYSQPILKDLNVRAAYYHYDEAKRIIGPVGASATDRIHVDLNAKFN